MAEVATVSNHLVIGLGGTGGKIIREIRKTIASDPNPNQDVNFEFLYVDSKPEFMKHGDPAWKILGKSVQLGTSQTLLIEGAALGQILRDIDAYPALSPWLGPLDVIERIAKTNVDSAQGGQRRKFGRFLFAYKANKFVEQLDYCVKAVQKRQTEQLVTFHVCVGLAGGTGSGCVVDVVSQIRKRYEGARILIYALLPELHPKPNWDSGNYHANGYAALLELNALAVGQYRPHDVAGDGARMTLPAPVFNGCYVFTNVNEAGMIVDVDTQVPGIVADFICQKTLGNSWEDLDKAEISENGNKDDERSSEDGKTNERSKLFLTFGIKRLVVPSEEIREFLAFHSAQQATRQFRYNNWVDGLGYADTARPYPYAEEVKKSIPRWCLTDEHLTLSEGILDEDKKNNRWRKITDYWDVAIAQNVNDIKSAFPKDRWLAELRKRLESLYTEGYRSLGGVKAFYATKIRERTEFARFIRGIVESEMFEDWVNGRKSLAEATKILSLLSEFIEDKLQQINAVAEKHNRVAEEMGTRLNQIAQEMNNVGVIGKILKKTEDHFNSASAAMRDRYISRTYAEGWFFGRKLLEELNAQIIELSGDVKTYESMLADSSAKFETEISARLRASRSGEQEHKTKLFNLSEVAGLNRRLTLDADLQSAQTQKIRRRVADALGGGTPSFSGIKLKLDAVKIRDILEDASTENVLESTSVITEEFKRILNANIVEKLYDEHKTSDDGLTRFVRDIVKSSGVYMTFDPTEEAKKATVDQPGFGTDAEIKHIKTSVLLLPDCKQRSEFSEKLIQTFESNNGGVAAFKAVSVGVKSNELTLLRIDNLFPLRFLAPLKHLEVKYKDRCRDENNRILLHGEGDGSDRPPLFIKSATEIQHDKRSFVVLARALGLVADRAHPTTGRTETVFTYEDEHGLPAEDVLGKTFIEAAEKLSARQLGKIERQVLARIQVRENLHQDRRTEIFKASIQVIKDVLASCGNDMQDPRYVRFKDTSMPIKRRLGLAD